MGRFDAKVFFITGASAGIGEALARELCNEGAKVAITARRADRLHVLAQELDPEGRRVRAYTADVTKDGEIERAVEAARKDLGPIDGVIANAGMSVPGNFQDLSLADYRRQMETNVFGVLRTIYACLDDVERSRGYVTIIDSINGYIAIPGVSAYVMSKFALRGFAEGVNIELKEKGVSLTLICPGFVHSEIRRIDRAGRFRPEVKDFVPSWIIYPTEKAARKIVTAIYRRRRELIFPLHGKVLVFLARHLSGALYGILKLAGVSGRPGK